MVGIPVPIDPKDVRRVRAKWAHRVGRLLAIDLELHFHKWFIGQQHNQLLSREENVIVMIGGNQSTVVIVSI